MDRIEKFFMELRDSDLTNNEIAAGLGNGDIEKPEWMAVSESTDHIKAWDTDDPGASSQFGFIWINYDD